MSTNKLMLMLKELHKYKRDKNKLISMYIEQRLSKSIQTYHKELTDSVAYLNRVDLLNVMKKLNKQ